MTQRATEIVRMLFKHDYVGRNQLLDFFNASHWQSVLKIIDHIPNLRFIGFGLCNC